MDKIEKIALGRWTEDKLQSFLNRASQIKDMGERIAFISKHFLEIPYKESSLIGSRYTPERFVIDMEGLDCFTFIDYVEAMRLSTSFSEFKENLKRIRYRRGNVSFKNRNHFFTDWAKSNSEFVEDITEKIGGKNSIKVKKNLNTKEDGTYILDGIARKMRIIRYIPSLKIDDAIINKLMSGDYIGIYSDRVGLDVSHVGIIIKNDKGVFLRHASSKKGKVIDEDLKSYLCGKTGLIVMRPRR